MRILNELTSFLFLPGLFLLCFGVPIGGMLLAMEIGIINKPPRPVFLPGVIQSSDTRSQKIVLVVRLDSGQRVVVNCENSLFDMFFDMDTPYDKCLPLEIGQRVSVKKVPAGYQLISIDWP